VIIFSSIRFLSKESNQTEFKKKTKTGSNRLVSVRFGFFGQKPVQTGLARFFRFGSVFFCFLQFGFGSVRYFRFHAYKIETELVDFFKILIGLIGFFSRFGFLGYFIIIFSV
jgi:hypothetical protein